MLTSLTPIVWDKAKGYADNIKLLGRASMRTRVSIQVQWSPSRDGWMTINMDGTISNKKDVGCRSRFPEGWMTINVDGPTRVSQDELVDVVWESLSCGGVGRFEDSF